MNKEPEKFVFYMSNRVPYFVVTTRWYWSKYKDIDYDQCSNEVLAILKKIEGVRFAEEEETIFGWQPQKITPSEIKRLLFSVGFKEIWGTPQQADSLETYFDGIDEMINDLEGAKWIWKEQREQV